MRSSNSLDACAWCDGYGVRASAGDSACPVRSILRRGPWQRLLSPTALQPDSPKFSLIRMSVRRVGCVVFRVTFCRRAGADHVAAKGVHERMRRPCLGHRRYKGLRSRERFSLHGGRTRSSAPPRRFTVLRQVPVPRVLCSTHATLQALSQVSALSTRHGVRRLQVPDFSVFCARVFCCLHACGPDNQRQQLR